MALALFSAASKIFQVFRFLATIIPTTQTKESKDVQISWNWWCRWTQDTDVLTKWNEIWRCYWTELWTPTSQKWPEHALLRTENIRIAWGFMFAFHSPKLVNFWLVSQVDHKMRYQIKKKINFVTISVLWRSIFSLGQTMTLENMLNTPDINWCFHRYHQFDPHISQL